MKKEKIFIGQKVKVVVAGENPIIPLGSLWTISDIHEKKNMVQLLEKSAAFSSGKWWYSYIFVPYRKKDIWE
jgi:hypothetical protein